MNKDVISSEKEATSSQKEMLFMRGKAMSGAPIINGTIQLPKPPIVAGMTMKNTMIRPWRGDEDIEHLRIAEDLHAGLHELQRACPWTASPQRSRPPARR